MFLPDLNNHECQTIKISDNTCHYKRKIDRSYMLKLIIDNMRMAKECVHCGKEFQSFKDEFCSFECANQTS